MHKKKFFFVKLKCNKWKFQFLEESDDEDTNRHKRHMVEKTVEEMETEEV